MFHKRLDNGCESKILACSDKDVFVEARWPIGASPSKQKRNFVNLTHEYFEKKYGFPATI